MPKSYRIRTEVGVDKYINVDLEQDFESLEILSLKILSDDVYTRFCSDYGVIVGRVIVNGGFGIPNAKLSLFIPLSEDDELNPIITELYPYQNLSDRNEEGYRYNLLPKSPSYVGHQATGTFPNRGDVLMDQSYIEVYDKYYRFNVKTNESGDFMMFGVPLGTQTLVMDVDLSDIGCFSLSPQDLINQGLATEAQVDGAQFKSSTNLDSLPQIVNLNFNIDVQPLWGDTEICSIGITRVDFDLTKLANIKIEPSAVFLGSIISTTDDDALKISCKPKNNTGNLCELIAGEGQIDAIRQTINLDNQGLPILERYSFPNDGKVIDGDGAFLVNVPMNMDYIYTNEFGQQVLSNDPKKGIPTKGKYRFKFMWINKEQTLSLSEFEKEVAKTKNKLSEEYGFKGQDSQGNFQRANFLVPNVKEYGWIKYDDDPLDLFKPTTFTYTNSAGIVSGSPVTLSAINDVGLQFDSAINTSSFTILINGVPYYGGINSITIPAGQTLQIIGVPININQPSPFVFTRYNQNLFNLYRSYTFSLDWDDYVNPQEAINCEDTFYEFNYNKVYTTSLFLDRYKNGIGRARHLGIKEIDNRTCKSEVNTFPVNDVIRNFDAIFFVYNIFVNILIFPILTLLWVTHFVAFIWPILKWVLLFLGIRWTIQSIEDLADAYDTGSEAINAALSMLSYVPPFQIVVDPGLTKEVIDKALAAAREIAFAALTVAGAAAFTAFITNAIFDFSTGTWRRLKIPKLGFPMISYPDCNTCDCDCQSAELDDNYTPQTIQAEIDELVQQGGISGDVELAVPNSFLAPVNSPAAYRVVHPNSDQVPPDDSDISAGPYWCGFLTRDFQSLQYSFQDEAIGVQPIIRANLDYARIFSGYDILSSSPTQIKLTANEKYLLHAPQPFLWAANKPSSVSPLRRRWFAFPLSVPYPQRLNEFNTRDKYFGVNAPNRIKVKVNNSPNVYEDQVIVMLANPGTSAVLIPGNIFNFQNPNLSNCWVNLTGATQNVFGTNAITGVTFTGQTTINVPYANPTSLGNTLVANNITITASSVTGIASTIPGQPGLFNYEESYLKYPIDLEYFQVVTGMTVGSFLSNSNVNANGFYPKDYLLHRIKFIRPNCTLVNPLSSAGLYGINTTTSALYSIDGYQNYEVIICVRGVDPHTQRQNIEYDVSRIFGKSFGNIKVNGNYFLNVPIQNISGQPLKPKTHLTTNNQGHGLYYPSYSFTISQGTPANPNFTAFTSNLPYYYLGTDDSVYTNYTPKPNFQGVNSYPQLSPSIPTVLATNRTIPYYSTNPLINAPAQNTYYGGSTFLGSQTNLNYGSFASSISQFLNVVYNKDHYFLYPPPLSPSANFPFTNVLYSAAYYRTFNNSPINFNDRTNIVMRSDRLPTSTKVENGLESNTGYAMHQNNNFTFYSVEGEEAPEQVIIGTTFIETGQQDLDPFTSGITQTLQCENMVSLQCYTGSGLNVGVLNPEVCPIPPGRVVNGCYCLLNKGDEVANKRWYLIGNAVKYDTALLLEWKVRFTLNFAACRGIFAQVFQNNWINGVLYMFSFNNKKLFGLDPNNPNQTNKPFFKTYCNDVIIWNELSNSYYYRSSPWNNTTQEFVGKQSPNTSGFLSGLLQFPGAAYNVKQIQFPTTVVDLGPRDSFINEICANPAFGSYYADQLNTTSYQDNSEILQLSFLSRILNEEFRKDMSPGISGNNVKEGVGVGQFFRNDRKGDRIDGDIAQMLSINSEWKVAPFITENVPGNNYIYFGLQGGNNNQNKPVFGVFFSSDTQELRYRKIMSPGIETYSFTPLIQQSFGYPKSQIVPNYKWIISGGTTIFGTENNNWFTESTNTNSGFFKGRYQNTNFTSTFQKYLTSNPSINFGYITNYSVGPNNTLIPSVSINNIIQGVPYANNNSGYSSMIVVGAPYYFYFGLNNGKTAVDKFFKLYVPQI